MNTSSGCFNLIWFSHVSSSKPLTFDLFIHHPFNMISPAAHWIVSFFSTPITYFICYVTPREILRVLGWKQLFPPRNIHFPSSWCPWTHRKDQTREQHDENEIVNKEVSLKMRCILQIGELLTHKRRDVYSWHFTDFRFQNLAFHSWTFVYLWFPNSQHATPKIVAMETSNPLRPH